MTARATTGVIAEARRALRALINGANTENLSPERFRYLTGEIAARLDDIERAIDPAATLPPPTRSHLTVHQGDRP